MKEFLEDYRRSKFQFSWFGSIFHTAWFTKDWWNFLLEKENGYTLWNGKYLSIKRRVTFRKFCCRMRGHAGVVWYSSGYEPDMTCKFCDDDLG